ncbi:MAG: hypothetical protein JO316_15080 [Abitibacteriaceae bacterium]|nr:hypothetical protein [Abditibacteriaceae bacterium]MBV9866675.1 hypothetical protein [Abditibacteriaceae bacterium]
MIYQGDLSSGQQVYIENNDGQTIVTLSQGKEHQQVQRSSFETGEWKETPTLFKAEDGAILCAKAGNEQFFFCLQPTGIHTLHEPPALADTDKLPLHETKEVPTLEPMRPMKPMEPIAPLKPIKPL